MFKSGDKIGIVCCSNGQKQTYKEKIKVLVNTLTEMGLQPVFSDCIYEKDSIFCGTARERAKALMDFYKNDKIQGIFDISGGDVAKIETYFCQLKQLGAFDKVAGIILGTFTEMEREKYVPMAAELLKKMVSENLPIAVTEDIGHGTDSKAIVIGQELCLTQVGLS